MTSPIRGAGRPRRYETQAGTKVPSVTQILGSIGNKDGIVYKAKLLWHEAGRRGLPFSSNAYWGDPESPTWGTDALTVGEIVHGWIQATMHGEALDTPDVDDEARAQANRGFAAFLRWREGSKVDVLATETPFVSERFGFGGTVDCYANVAGTPALIDWKTSNRVYAHYVAQLAAYRELLREHGRPVDAAYLLRVGKESGDFAYYSFSDETLDLGWRLFRAAHRVYHELERVERRLVS